MAEGRSNPTLIWTRGCSTLYWSEDFSGLTVRTRNLVSSSTGAAAVGVGVDGVGVVGIGVGATLRSETQDRSGTGFTETPNPSLVDNL